MWPVAIFAIAYLGLFITIEWIARAKQLGSESSRKLAHILSGASVALLPSFLGFGQIAVLAGVFIVVMATSQRLKIFKAIHSVDRQTYGEIYFAISILVLAVLFAQPRVFIYGVLVMTFSDAAASLLGGRWGRKKYQLFGHQKSFVGSTAFLVTAWIIGILVFSGFIWQRIASAGMLAIVLSVIEASLHGGLDNLAIPILASWMFSIAATLVR